MSIPDPYDAETPEEAYFRLTATVPYLTTLMGGYELEAPLDNLQPEDDDAIAQWATCAHLFETWLGTYQAVNEKWDTDPTTEPHLQNVNDLAITLALLRSRIRKTLADLAPDNGDPLVVIAMPQGPDALCAHVRGHATPDDVAALELLLRAKFNRKPLTDDEKKLYKAVNERVEADNIPIKDLADLEDITAQTNIIHREG